MTSVSRAALVGAIAAFWLGGATAASDAVLVRIWEDPRPIASRDLYWGPGRPSRAPQAPFTFVEESDGGTQPKLVVTDAAGVAWDVKFGPEAHAEVAATRLVWAFGYMVDENYFVAEGVIAGARDLGRAKAHVDAVGRFTAARFERQLPEHHHVIQPGWSFQSNPFRGKPELSGLKILMTLIGNWDIEGARNNRLVEVREPGRRPYRRHMVSDLGASFGRMGARFTNHSKWQLEDYRGEGFIDAVSDEEVEFDFDGLESGMDRVPLEHVRWFAALAAELTPAQVRRAFEAAGASPAEIDGFSEVVLARLDALRTAAGAEAARAVAR